MNNIQNYGMVNNYSLGFKAANISKIVQSAAKQRKPYSTPAMKEMSISLNSECCSSNKKGDKTLLREYYDEYSYRKNRERWNAPEVAEERRRSRWT